MSDNDLLLLIAAITGITTLIQCIEMWLLVSSSRQTNRILSKPGELFTHLIEQLADDPKFREEFWGLVQATGIKALEAISTMPEVARQQAIKGLPRPVRSIIEGAQALGIDFKKIFKTEAVDKAKEVVEWGQA